MWGTTILDPVRVRHACGNGAIHCVHFKGCLHLIDLLHERSAVCCQHEKRCSRSESTTVDRR